MRLCLLALAGLVSLAACSGGSGSNPLGSFGSSWFGGGDRRAETTATVRERVEDRSPLVAGIVNVVPEAALRGLIIRATGVTATQGFYNARLVPVGEGTPDDNGILTLAFRADPPETAQPAGPQRSRQVIAAAFVPDSQLDGIRGFVVISASNSVSLRR